MCLLTSKPTYLILKAQTTAFNAEIRLDYILQSPPVSRAIHTDASDQTVRIRETFRTYNLMPKYLSNISVLVPKYLGSELS